MIRSLQQAAVLLALPALANAQYILERFTGNPFSLDFGVRVAMAGDTDGDGYDDPIVAGSGSGSVEEARVFSGRTGALLRVHSASLIGLGVAIGSAGDLDGDGRADYFISANDETGPGGPGSGVVTVYSGATGAVLRQYWGDAQADRFGSSAANVGDVNGDGYDEIAGGAPGNDSGGTNAGQVKVFSGADGSLLFQAFGTGTNGGFGQAVAGCGDVNADGVPDVVVGAPRIGASSGAPGYARVYSGVNFALLRQLNGAGQEDWFGVAVAGAGDVNSDGHADLVIGASMENFGFTDAGSATVFSGFDGSMLFKRGGGAANALAGNAVASLDFDGDGVPDIAVGAPNEGFGAGVVRVYRGSDGALLQTIAASSTERLGIRLASAGDYDGNGEQDLLAGAPGAQQARIYSRTNCAFERICVRTPNSVGAGALLAHSGNSSVASNSLVLRASGLPADTTSVFYFGSAVLQIPYFDGVRCASGQVLRLPATGSDSSGNVSFAIDHSAPSPVLALLAAGSTWTFQLVYRDTGFGTWGVNTSDALTISFCP